MHEAGHFTAAKAVGMRVERFFLFFPPKLWSIKRGETEYGVGAIPLGGYVRITGMNPEEELHPEAERRGRRRAVRDPRDRLRDPVRAGLHAGEAHQRVRRSDRGRHAGRRPPA